MNQDTLWLQVPAAKPHTVKLVEVSTSPDKLKYIAAKLASLQGYEYPYLEKINVILFISENGITNQDKFSLTTPELLNKFSAELEIINLGKKTKLKYLDEITHSTLTTNTTNFNHAPAMSEEQFSRAINIGRQSAQRIHRSGSQIFIAGALNNNNILSTHALTCALLDIKTDELFSINSEQCKLINQALIQHKKQLTSPLEILRHLGSFEISALMGSYLCCAHIGMPVLIDGLSAAIAAFITEKLCPGAEKWFLYSHTSTNPAHQLILKSLGAQPLLQLNQRLDGIAGIVSTLSLLHLACTNYNEVINFPEESFLTN